MRRFLMAASLAALTSGVMLADTVSVSGSDTFINMPSNATFAANTATGNTPYWNNKSSDAPPGNPFNASTQGFNAGYFLTDTGAFSSNTLAPTTSQYLGNTGNNNLAPNAFSFLQNAASIQVTLLYQNAGANATAGGNPGTIFGIYDTSNINNKTVIYASGTIPANVNVVKNVSTYANYGFYATTCNTSGGSCFTFYTNPSLNPNVTNFGAPTVVEASGSHQHFALFNVAGQPLNFYLGYEDSTIGNSWVGTGGFENYGDFNDVIIKISTTTVPEPGTFAFLGLGLVALGWRARQLRK